MMEAHYRGLHFQLFENEVYLFLR